MSLLRRDAETLTETLTAQNRVELRRCVHLKRRQDMAVSVESQANLRVPERLHDRPRVNALREQQRRRRVPPVRFWVTPYFASTPTSPLTSLVRGGDPRRSVERFEMAYGLISRFFAPDGTSSPTTSAASDTSISRPTLLLRRKRHSGTSGQRARRRAGSGAQQK